MLEEIVKLKIEELREAKASLPIRELKSIIKQNNYRTRGFLNTLKNKIASGKPGLIAEIKFASPSKGVIRNNISLEEVSEAYERNTFVDCISVLTEKRFFHGDISFITKTRSITTKPILRKDFIIDEYQIYESIYYGADCILLIVSSLSRSQLVEFLDISKELGLDVLVEIFEDEDIQKIEGLNIELLGINSRNLKTLEVSLDNHLYMLSKINSKPPVLVAESGIKSRDDVIRGISNGFNAFLIGESIISSDNMSLKINSLFEGVNL